MHKDLTCTLEVIPIVSQLEHNESVLFSVLGRKEAEIFISLEKEMNEIQDKMNL